MLLILLGVGVALPTVTMLVLPLLSSVDKGELINTRQSMREMSGTLIWVRMAVYAAMIFIMPVAMGLPPGGRRMARWYAVLLVAVVEVILVQRLWLF